MANTFSLKSFLSNTKIDFMRFHKLVILISIISIIASISLVFFRGLNFGIDFSGGILIEARLAEKADLTEIRNLLSEENFGEINIQNFDEKDLMIRVSMDKEGDKNITIKKIQEILGNNFDNIEYRKVDFVGPQVGKELIINGLLSLLLSFIFIMIYIWVRFDWQFGLGAILALIHDAALMLGFFSLTGLEFNLTSIAAILTIIGYSINDSVVIYDRVRENLRKYKKMNLSELLNISINSTLSRTALTAGVTLASLLALIIYGGDVLKSFSISVFFGIIIGTYSSIYISAPILLYMDPRKKEEKNSK